ncbi:CRISPR-associated endonuclease Cas2 [Mycolicibacterium hassiacum]|uniref:CRISPR-associated endonuclease Cas2 n=1 Tax=Mycolicibacterium hassiacum TaxID=46351 RepID=UPI000368440D|nr:CRISPR-associated endonuclease Cas2 [Mycolicibacterium hassiacum]MDA4088290.1 CRISPR-associated protein [Mycolicibacterium hassiacum DSM 44199]
MTRKDARRFLIAYDVPSDQRRSRLSNKLQAYGDRVQYSVFVVDASPAKLRRLRHELSQIIEASEDSVLLCDLGLVSAIQEDRFVCIGRTRPITDQSVIVI